MFSSEDSKYEEDDEDISFLLVLFFRLLSFFFLVFRLAWAGSETLSMFKGDFPGKAEVPGIEGIHGPFKSAVVTENLSSYGATDTNIPYPRR